MILIHRFFRAYFIVIYNLYNIGFTTVLSDVKPGCIIQNGKIFLREENSMSLKEDVLKLKRKKMRLF